jgi:crotonobetainyl-CoA:carnitine CoA-transferase CaiB-like acyl-CoA transferase
MNAPETKFARDEPIWSNWRHVTAFANLGEEWWSYANFGGRYATYPASDGKIILACPIEKNFWQSFCDVLGLPEDWKARGGWGKSEMDHGTAYPWERAGIAKQIAQKPRERRIEEFTRARIPFAPLLSLGEMLAAPHVEAIGAMRDVDVDGHSARIPACPVSFVNQPASASPMRTPGLGEHNAEIFDELGMSRDVTARAK